jgi:subtilase family serine protease
MPPVEVAPAFRPAAGVVELGPDPANASMEVAVGLPTSDPGGLTAFVDASEVPGTPEYQEFLSPAEADARYGASPASVAAAEAYFQGFGLASQAQPDGLLLLVSGPTASVARAFATSFDVYRTAGGVPFVSHPSAATLPASLPTTGVFGLGDVDPLAPAAIGSTPDSAVPAAGCTAASFGLTPCDIDTAYNETPLLTNGTDGAGFRPSRPPRVSRWATSSSCILILPART